MVDSNVLKVSNEIQFINLCNGDDYCICNNQHTLTWQQTTTLFTIENFDTTLTV